MPAESVMIEQEDREENQFVLLFQNVFYATFNYSLYFIILAMHYSMMPAMLLYSFWKHAVDQIWQISKQIFQDVKELLKIIPLTIEMWFWSAMIFMEMLFLLKRVEEIGVEVEQRIYNRIKKILDIVNGLPMNPKNAAALYAALKKIPIFGKLIPFPHFLFEQTFKKVGYRRGAVSILLPSQDVNPGVPQESTSTAPATTTDDSKPGILKRTSFRTTKSEERLPKITDEPAKELSESTTPITSSSL